MRTQELVWTVCDLVADANDAIIYFYDEHHSEPVYEATVVDNNKLPETASERIYDYRHQSHLIMIYTDKTVQVFRTGYLPDHYEWRKIFDQKDYSRDAQYQKAIDLAIKLGKIKATATRMYYDDCAPYCYTASVYNHGIHRINVINRLLCEYFATDIERDTMGLSTEPGHRLWTDLGITADKWKCVFDNSKKDFHSRLQLQIEELFIPVLLRID